jgi:hypothetical protein
VDDLLDRYTLLRHLLFPPANSGHTGVSREK